MSKSDRRLVVDGGGVESMDGVFKEVKLNLRVGVWGVLREEALKGGKRGVGSYVEGVVGEHVRLVLEGRERALSVGKGGEDVVFEEVMAKEDRKTKREMLDVISGKVDEWVLKLIDDEGALNALPDSAKAQLLMSRLPKLGVSKGEMEERAFGLIGALKGLGEVEDLQGELVTLREEVARLDGEKRSLEGELLLVLDAGETRDGEKVGDLAVRFARLGMAWRDVIKGGLVGREQAGVCGMLRDDKLVELWTDGAMRVAKESAGCSVVLEDFSRVKDLFE